MTIATTDCKQTKPPPEPAQTPGRSGPAKRPSSSELPVVVVTRQDGWALLDFRELWRYRELFYFLTWRDIKVRYKQTALGAAWAVLQPLATMIVFSLFFGKLRGVAPEGVPYPLFVLIGLLAWTLFASAINNAGGSVVGSQDLVTKVYFPRLMIPMGSIGVSVVDFAISTLLLAPLMIWYGVIPGWSVLFAPFFLLLLIVGALGVGTLLSALTVAYRDFRYLVPFLVQLWMFATPSIYMDAKQVVSPTVATFLPLNPAYGVILNLRHALIGEPLEWRELAISGIVSLVFLVIGCLYFRRVERHFADII